MAQVLTDESNYEDIADAIRTRAKTNAQFLPSEMADAILNIHSGIPDNVKTALLNLLQHVAFTDGHGEDYYNALEAALYADDYPKIVASFDSGSSVIYTDDSLDSLKQYLTVKYYEDAQSTGTTIASSNYTLSGTLAEGSSVISVHYNNLVDAVTIYGVVDFYNVWEWSTSNTDYSKLTRTPTAAFEKTIDGEKLGISYADNMISANSLRGFAVTKGKHKMRKYSDGSVANYYPIPIPQTAEKITATITPSDQKIALYVFKYNGGGRSDGYDYELVAPSQIGYVTGQYVLNITPGSDLFLTFNCTPGSGNYGANPEPQMHILFE